MADSSTATLGRPIQSRMPLVGFSTNWRSPADVINKAAAAATTSSQLSFPDEVIKYYMTFNMAQYSGGAFASGGSGNLGRTVENTPAAENAGLSAATKTIGQIILPLPDSLVDLQTVSWVQANLLQESFSAAGKMLGGIATIIGAHTGGLSTFASWAGIGVAGAGALEALGIYLRTRGVAPNQFVTVLLNGPQYKQHNFKWTLAPKTPKEADNLRKIIMTFNNCMAPGLSTNSSIMGAPGLWWNFPNIFFIKFVPNPEYLFEFKPAVLTDFGVDYASGHVPSFLRSDSATQDKNPPEAVSIHMQFLEIEYWKNGDFGEEGAQDQGAAISNTSSGSFDNGIPFNPDPLAGLFGNPKK